MGLRKRRSVGLHRRVACGHAWAQHAATLGRSLLLHKGRGVGLLMGTNYGYSQQTGYQTSDFRLLWTITLNPPSPPPPPGVGSPPPPLESGLLPDPFPCPPPVSHFVMENGKLRKLENMVTPTPSLSVLVV